MERIARLLLTMSMIIALASGCGGGSNGSRSSEGSTANVSAEFRGSPAENATAKFGEEADEDEREAASGVLEENLDARATGEWSAQCATLSARAAKAMVARGVIFKVKTCPKSLAVQARPVAATKPFRANPMTGPIDALRIKGDEGFALFHGTGGIDYAMKMEKEDGEWKVASIRTRTFR